MVAQGVEIKLLAYIFNLITGNKFKSFTMGTTRACVSPINTN